MTVPSASPDTPRSFDPATVVSATAGEQYVPSARSSTNPILTRSALEPFKAAHPTINGTLS